MSGGYEQWEEHLLPDMALHLRLHAQVPGTSDCAGVGQAINFTEDVKTVAALCPEENIASNVR